MVMLVTPAAEGDTSPASSPSADDFRKNLLSSFHLQNPDKAVSTDPADPSCLLDDDEDGSESLEHALPTATLHGENDTLRGWSIYGLTHGTLLLPSLVTQALPIIRSLTKPDHPKGATRLGRTQTRVEGQNKVTPGDLLGILQTMQSQIQSL